MKVHLDTWFTHLGNNGLNIAHLKLELETTDVDVRNKVHNAIMKVLAPQEEPKEEKQSAIGFGTNDD